MKVKLGDIAELQFGFYSKTSDNGSVAYLLAKHFDEWGNKTENVDSYIQIDGKSEGHLLVDGDILLVGKGMRNFAWTYRDSCGPAIASSIFFVVKVHRDKVLPEYLSTLFNMTQTQAYFQSLGAGNSIPSIRKSELEAFTIDLPELDLQQKVIELKQLFYKDMELTHEILKEKQRVYQAVIKNIISKNHE